MNKFILEYIKSIDENGNNVQITEESVYNRYNDEEYDSFDEAMIARCNYMENENNIYIKVTGLCK